MRQLLRGFAAEIVNRTVQADKTAVATGNLDGIVVHCPLWKS